MDSPRTQESSLPLPNWAWFSPTQWNQVPRETRASHGKRTNLDEENPLPRARVGEQSYEPIVPAKVENRRAPERGGHGSHWREGVNR
jgi:hypothetical protein